MDGEPREILEENSRFLKDDLGIFLPQVADLGFCLRDSSWSINRLALTIQEAEGQFSRTMFTKKAETPLPFASLATKEPGQDIIQISDVKFAYPKGEMVVKGVSFNIRAKASSFALWGRMDPEKLRWPS